MYYVVLLAATVTLHGIVVMSVDSLYSPHNASKTVKENNLKKNIQKTARHFYLVFRCPKITRHMFQHH